MARLPSWPERLAAHVASNVNRPFAWGAHDCVTFAAGAVEAVTGVRPPMPTWNSAAEAQRHLRAVGGLVAAVESVGFAARERRFAQRGDLLLIDAELVVRPFLAVCLGHVWAAPGLTGLEYGPPSAASRGWKVG